METLQTTLQLGWYIEREYDIRGDFETEVSLMQATFDEHYMRLPGRDPYPVRYDCGTVRKVGRTPSGGAVVRKNWCYERDCPICYRTWGLRLSESIASKLLAYSAHKGGGLFHWWAYSKTEQDKEKVLKRIKKLFKVGYAIFHPWRYTEATNHYRLGCHWHIVTDVPFLETKTGYEKDGFLAGRIREIGFTKKGHKLDITKKEDLRKTLSYDLSHAGIEGGKRVPRPFGAIYKYKVDREASKEDFSVDGERAYLCEFTADDPVRDDRPGVGHSVTQKITVTKVTKRTMKRTRRHYFVFVEPGADWCYEISYVDPVKVLQRKIEWDEKG